MPSQDPIIAALEPALITDPLAIIALADRFEELGEPHRAARWRNLGSYDNLYRAITEAYMELRKGSSRFMIPAGDTMVIGKRTNGTSSVLNWRVLDVQNRRLSLCSKPIWKTPRGFNAFNEKARYMREKVRLVASKALVVIQPPWRPNA